MRAKVIPFQPRRRWNPPAPKTLYCPFCGFYVTKDRTELDAHVNAEHTRKLVAAFSLKS